MCNLLSYSMVIWRERWGVETCFLVAKAITKGNGRMCTGIFLLLLFIFMPASTQEVLICLSSATLSYLFFFGKFFSDATRRNGTDKTCKCEEKKNEATDLSIRCMLGV